MSARLRQIGPVGVVLVLTAIGFFVTRDHGESDARHDASHRAEIAATRVRDHVAQATTLVDGVRRFLVGEESAGATPEQFAEIGARWLSPVGLPAAAWIERVSGPERADYERRTGRLIVVPTSSGGLRPAALRTTYLPATLVTGSQPLSSPGIDLGSVPGIAAAVSLPRTAYRVTATPFERLPDGTTGVFLVQSAQRLNRGVVEPGYVALFLPASWLLAGAADTGGSDPKLEIAVGGPSAGNAGDAETAESTFTTAGQAFAVRVPRGGVHGAARLQPWLVLVAGLMLSVLAAALRVIAARRTKAKAELDRLFALTPDLIAVAGFDGYFKRVNPAFEVLLGYSQEEALSRPYVDFVHPDDREETESRSGHLRQGEMTIAFENRYVCKDGSIRWLEWTSAPVVEERLIYAVARDVTDRRRTDAEQAALRRVATLVAGAASPAEVFAGTTAEVRRVIGSDSASLARYEPDGTLTYLAHDANGDSVGGIPVVGVRVSAQGESASGVVLRTGRAARMSLDTATGPVAELARSLGVVASVGAPIVVKGQLWGVIIVSTKSEPLPADTERRLADFTELVATGIAEAESRAALGRLAAQQAALRRVATLVAKGVPPAEMFSAVADEVSLLLESEATVIGRLEADGKVSIVAIRGSASDETMLGNQFEPSPGTVIATIIETGRPASTDADHPSSEPALRLGLRSGIGVPIVVGGTLWGVVAIGTVREQYPDDAEQRLEEFTELTATAIANAASRSEVAASRARIVAASDEARRRIERDLHDGTQQRLVSLSLDLRLAESTVPEEFDETRKTLARAAGELVGVIDELREISRGIHPAILSEGGLGPALRTLARRSAVPVALGSVIDERLSEPIEVAAYYVVSEALANATKHASASRVDIEATVRDGCLWLSIRDDGVGGADPAGGSGLVGLRDRAEAMGGSIEITSPPGRGTHVSVRLPLELDLNPDESQEPRPARAPANL